MRTKTRKEQKLFESSWLFKHHPKEPMLSPSRWMRAQLGSDQTHFGNNWSSHGAVGSLAASQANLIQTAHREGVRLAVVEADTRFVSPFVKLSCEDVADQLLLVYASNKQWEPGQTGAVIQLAWDRWMHTRIHKYSCFLGFFLSYTHAHVYSYRAITHLQYHIANAAHNKDRGNQIAIFTHRNTHRQTHTQMCDSPGKGQESQYPRDQTRPGPFSPSVSALSLSISGWWGGFWLGGQGASARLGKDTKQQPWQPESPSFPFKPTPIQPPACQDPGQEKSKKSNWPPIRLIRPY